MSSRENGKQTPVRRLWDRFSQGQKTKDDEETVVNGIGDANGGGNYGAIPNETDPLLPGRPADQQSEGHGTVGGETSTTPRKELATILSFALPTVFTMMLQQALLVTSLVTAGRLGTLEIGAVNLAEMVIILTWVAPIAGLSGSLDTLCAQAFGSGNKHLVGLHMQRMMALMAVAAIPVAILWLNIEPILVHLIPDPRSVELTAQCIRWLTLAIPGISLSECAKRYVSSQGLFQAIALAVIGSASINIFLHWFLVFKLGWGFVGLPVALAVSELIFPINVFLYVLFVDGRDCWGGLSKRAFVNWGSMLRLAIPSMIMVLAEWMAWEILALISVQFGTDYLAANGVLISMAGFAVQVYMGISIAASTRIGQWIGAGLVDAAKTAAWVSLVVTAGATTINCLVLMFLNRPISTLFTSDPSVLALVAATAPVLAVSTISDGFSTLANGYLRALGRQKIGGLTAVIMYWVVGLPFAALLAFKFDMKVTGLWLGLGVTVVLVCAIENMFVVKMNWHDAVREANARNAAN